MAEPLGDPASTGQGRARRPGDTRLPPRARRGVPGVDAAFAPCCEGARGNRALRAFYFDEVHPSGSQRRAFGTLGMHFLIRRPSPSPLRLHQQAHLIN